jgi:hypothetical protein
MPPFGFGRKEEPQSFTIDITDKEDLDEQVLLVARQSRFKLTGNDD